MSSSKNYHKSIMCGVCGKVVRDDTLKRHMSAMHGNAEEIAQDDQHDQPFKNNPTEACNQEDELLAEMDARDGELTNTLKSNHDYVGCPHGPRGGCPPLGPPVNAPDHVTTQKRQCTREKHD